MSIKSEIRSGVFYTFIFRYTGVATQIFTTAILARLLTPEEFGVVVAVFVFVTFFQLISDSGLAAAIIQKKELSEQDIFSLFVFTVISGIILAILFALAGPIISNFYGNKEYTKISALLSISLFLYAIHIVPSATLYRDKRFKAIGTTNFVVQILSALFAIFLAWKGFSYYALVYQAIFQSLIRFVIVIWLAPITFYKRIGLKVIREIFHYSIFKLLYDILQYFSTNLDNLLIGKYLGVIPLGFYDKAYKLMLMPVSHLADVISPVLHPVLSAHQDDLELVYNFYKKLIKFLAIIGIPLSIFLFFSADEIIRILFGNQWVGSIIAFKYLALAIWAQMIISGSGSFFLTLGRSDYLFLSGFFSSLVLVSAIFIGLFGAKSIEGISLYIMIAFFINLFQVYYFIIVKILKLKLFDFLSSMKTGIIIGIVILFINIIISYFLKTNNIFLSFSIKLGSTLVLFLLMLIILKELKNLLDTVKVSKK